MPSSQPRAPASRPPSATTKPPLSSKQDHINLDALHAAIARMHGITPPDPYMLTIPQDEPRFHHWSRQSASQWLDHTPFNSGEVEYLQYQTFHFHEPGKEMFVQHNTYLEEMQRRDKAVGGMQRPGTAEGATPTAGAPKKKITLGAYKRKRMDGPKSASTSPPEIGNEIAPSKQAAVKGPAEKIKAETEQVLATVGELEGTQALALSPAAKPTENKRKRVREDTELDEAKIKQPAPPTTPPEAEARQAKKPRTSSPLPPIKRPAMPPEHQAKEQVQTQESATPPRSSQEVGLPPKLSPLQSPLLPPLLSPTLPPNITAAADARRQKQDKAEEERAKKSDREQTKLSTSQSSTMNAESKDRLTLGKKHNSITKHKSPIPKNGFRTNSSSPAVRPDVGEKLQSKGQVPKRAKSPPSDVSQGDKISPSTRQCTKGPSKPSLVVKLKFDKNARKSVQALLKFPPKPVQIVTAKAEDDEGEREVRPRAGKTVDRRDISSKGVAQKGVPQKGVAQKITPTFKAAQRKQEDKKRSLPADNAEAPPSKRQKVPEPIRMTGPSTPVQSNVQSPHLQRQQITPSTLIDHAISSSMKRTMSTESNMPTPSAKSAGTPVLNGCGTNKPQANGLARSLSNQTSSKTSIQQAWEDEQTTLQSLGRELKHAATAHMQKTEPSHKKLAAIKAVESLLCYIFAFTCSDQALLAADPKRLPNIKTWQSLTGFFKLVKTHCEPFPLLAGLVSAIGLVFNAHILHLATHSASSSSDDSATTLSRHELLDTFVALQREANLVESKLDLDTLMKGFPKTWADRRRSSHVAASSEKLRPGRFAGGEGYRLPIGVQTPPVQLARAGHAMLDEWIQDMGVEYVLQLRLS